MYAAINSYSAIREELKRGFKRYKHHTNVTGLIIAPSESDLTKSEIIPHIERWFHRSDFYTDFFMGGYAVNPGDDEIPDRVPVKRIRGDEWFFSALLFDQFVKEIETHTKWNYSGDTDFILTAARYDPKTKEAWLDFSSAIAIDLQLAKHEEAILSVPHLFE